MVTSHSAGERDLDEPTEPVEQERYIWDLQPGSGTYLRPLSDRHTGPIHESPTPCAAPSAPTPS